MRVAEGLREVRAWDPGQLSLRLVLLVGPLVALVTAGAAGNGPAVWAVAVVVLLSVGWAAAPESLAGALALVTVLLWWTRVPDDALHPVVLVAAVAVVASHVAAVLSGTAPPRTPLDPAVLRLWVLRGCAILAVSPALWVLARALRDEAAPAGLWPAALVAALLVVVGLAATFARPVEEP